MSEQKSWQARIAEATDALGQDFVESVSYDWRLYKQDVAGSLAHAAMLAKVGLITEDDRAAIERGLREIEAEIDEAGPDWAGFDKQYEDIHMCVEKALIDKVGEPGRKLHTGRSRNDQVATDLVHVATRRSSLELWNALQPAQRALCVSRIAVSRRRDAVVHAPSTSTANLGGCRGSGVDRDDRIRSNTAIGYAQDTSSTRSATPSEVVRSPVHRYRLILQ